MHWTSKMRDDRDFVLTAAALTKLGIKASLCVELHALSRTIRRRDERACSDPRWTERDGECTDRMIAEYQAKLPKRARLYHQGDPRGCSLYVLDARTHKDTNLDADYSRGIALVSR